MKEEAKSNSVERALSIFEQIAESNHGLSNSDLSRRLKIPKSSASYILRVLENRHYLQRDEGGKYRLGLKLVSLTRDALTHLDIREISRPILEQFLKKSGLSEAHLAVLDNGRAVYVEKVEAQSFVKMDIWVGHRLPIHTTAIGKALTAYLPEIDVLKMLDQHGLEKKTRKSITNKSRFLAELGKVRKFGFAIDDEENEEGVRCLAAPVFDSNGKVAAALGTSTIVMRLNESQLPKIAELIKDAANKVSQRQGYSLKAL